MIPLAQSLVLGVIAAVIVLGVCYWRDWQPPLPPAVMVGGLTMGIWLVTSFMTWRDSEYPREPLPMVHAVEAAPPQPEPRKPINVYYTNEAGYQAARHYYLPVTDRQLELLARGLLVEGKPFSERAWAGKYRPFSITEFETLRDEMVTRQLAEWKDTDSRQLGLRLTAEGHRIMEQVLKKEKGE